MDCVCTVVPVKVLVLWMTCLLVKGTVRSQENQVVLCVVILCEGNARDAIVSKIDGCVVFFRRDELLY